jgi:hypothetical protein
VQCEITRQTTRSGESGTPNTCSRSEVRRTASHGLSIAVSLSAQDLFIWFPTPGGYPCNNRHYRPSAGSSDGHALHGVLPQYEDCIDHVLNIHETTAPSNRTRLWIWNLIATNGVSFFSDNEAGSMAHLPTQDKPSSNTATSLLPKCHDLTAQCPISVPCTHLFTFSTLD